MKKPRSVYSERGFLLIGTSASEGLIFANLRSVFARPDASKADVVATLKDYLPNFQHIEKGKGLDSRM